MRPWELGSKTVVATDAQVQTTDETHYDDIPLPESYYSIEKVNAGDPDLPTWLKWNAKTGEIYTDQVLTNADALGTWNLNLVFYDGHGASVSQTITVNAVDVLNLADDAINGYGSTDVRQEDDKNPYTHTNETLFRFKGDDGITSWRIDPDDVPPWLKDSGGNVFVKADADGGYIRVYVDDPGHTLAPINTDVGNYDLIVYVRDNHNAEFAKHFTIQVPNKGPNS